MICAALAAAAVMATVARSATAGWEPAQTIDTEPTADNDFGATFASDGLSVGANGLATALFFQQVTQQAPDGSQSMVFVPFMARRAADMTAWTAPPAAVPTPSPGQAAAVPPTLASQADGSSIGMFVFNPSAGGTQTLASNWPAGANAPSAAMQMFCTAGDTPECAIVQLQVAFDNEGKAYAVGLNAGANADVLFTRTDPTTGAWQAAQILQTGSQATNLAVDPAGNVVVVYTRVDPGNNEQRLFGRRLLAGATDFESEVVLSGPNNVNNNALPGLVMDQSGTATAAFLEDTVPGPFIPGTSTQAPAVQAVRWPLGGAPEAETTLSEMSEGVPADVVLVVDPDSRVTAAWDAGPPFTGPLSIFAAQFVAGQWTTTPVTPPFSMGSFSNAQLATDAAGTVTVAYEDTVPGSDTTLLAQRKPLDQPWSEPVAISSAKDGAGPVSAPSWHVAAAEAFQADVTFVQAFTGMDGTQRNRLFATRFSPLTITITKPMGGDMFTQGDMVNADFTCEENDEGPGLDPMDPNSCVGTVADGARFDTATAGDKTFTVTATDKAGNTATQSVTYTVNAPGTGTDTTKPTITINAPTDGATFDRGQQVNANFECQEEAGGSGVKSCDGTVPNGQPIDTATLGDKTFTVTAADNAGNMATQTVKYKVSVPDQPPVAMLTATPTEGPAPLTVSFDGSGSRDPDGDVITQYTFDFGDGTPVTSQADPTAQHTYLVPGEFVAKLTVTDARGTMSDPVQAPIKVDNPGSSPPPPSPPPGGGGGGGSGDPWMLALLAIPALRRWLRRRWR